MREEDTRKADRPDEIREEYDFDYSKSKPNRFAAGLQTGSVSIVLDPVVAEVFSSAEAVNTILRSVISALPPSKRTSSSGS